MLNAQDFDRYLAKLSEAPLHVIDRSLSLKDYVAIDLSSGNLDFSSLDINSSQAIGNYINGYLKKYKALVAYGGYLEQRNIYKRSTNFKQATIDEERNIHLGLDIWCHVGTKVLAVLEGEIHSFKNNTNFGDYGPTIILKHQLQGNAFYSLYGHLNLDSIQDLQVGQKVLQGEVIGYLGDHTVNGDYAPHLHFQLIRDLEAYFGDYPGVSSRQNLDFFRQNCPNPNLLLKIN